VSGGAPAGGHTSAGVLAELATALMFLTRLPVFGAGSGDPGVLSRATRWFPLVGALVGLLLGLLAWLAAMALPPGPAAVLVLIAGVLITGAFHEDGLADVADSAGAFGIDRKLEIMRDSRVGTYGALALLLLVLAKFALLVPLIQSAVPLHAAPSSCAPLFAALVGAHVAGRWSSVYLMARIGYVRPEAANRVVAEGVNERRLAESVGVAMPCLLLLAAFTAALPGGGPGTAVTVLIGVPIVSVTVSALGGAWCRRVFGGITGDCLGAVNQVLEVAVLMLFVMAFAGP